jgi:CDP-diacylglycerol--glycerol-3-phosphate 3-phosphatidyltransferase
VLASEGQPDRTALAPVQIEEMVRLFDGRFRTGVDRVVRPMGAALVRTGLAPDHLTTFGLLLAVPTALAIGSGHLGVGLALLIFSAVPDLLDGALAKASGRATVRGAFFDSVCDRVTDTLVLGGFAWYLQDRDGGHAAMLPFAVLGVSLLVSYLRAKAESLGFDAKGGLMERAERIIVLCAGLAFSVLLVPLLWAMLGLTVVTAGQRFWKVWRQASASEGLDPTRSAPAPATRGAARPPATVVPRTMSRPTATVGAAATDTAATDTAATDTAGSDAARSGVGRAVSTPADPMLLTERWRAWRESTGWVPRADRYAPGTRRGAAGERRRRRQQREQAAAEAPHAGRRRSSRRP